MSKIKKLISALLVLVMAIAPCAALAEETIDSTVTIVVPFAAGGTSDILARIFPRTLPRPLGRT